MKFNVAFLILVYFTELRECMNEFMELSGFAALWIVDNVTISNRRLVWPSF